VPIPLFAPDDDNQITDNFPKSILTFVRYLKGKIHAPDLLHPTWGSRPSRGQLDSADMFCLRGTYTDHKRSLKGNYVRAAVSCINLSDESFELVRLLVRKCNKIEFNIVVYRINLFPISIPYSEVTGKVGDAM
jgi:hypothetical protein